jgi:hypothetical protein
MHGSWHAGTARCGVSSPAPNPGWQASGSGVPAGELTGCRRPRVTQLSELLAETSRMRLQWPGHPDTEQVGHGDRLLLLEQDLEEEEKASITQAGLCRTLSGSHHPRTGQTPISGRLLGIIRRSAQRLYPLAGKC